MSARLASLLPRLNERDRRLALAAEARSWGAGWYRCRASGDRCVEDNYPYGVEGS